MSSDFGIIIFIQQGTTLIKMSSVIKVEEALFCLNFFIIITKEEMHTYKVTNPHPTPPLQQATF